MSSGDKVTFGCMSAYVILCLIGFIIMIFDTDVYICSGPMSTKYHKEIDCIAFRNCSGEVLSLPKKDAVEKGYIPCRFCYE